ASAIVPAAVEQSDFAARRQMLDVALEIPLSLFALARRGKRDDAALARVEHMREHVDRAALAGGVAAFEQDDDALPGLRHPARHRAELLGQWLQELLILLLAELALAAHSSPRSAGAFVARGAPDWNRARSCGMMRRPAPAVRRHPPAGRDLRPAARRDGRERRFPLAAGRSAPPDFALRRRGRAPGRGRYRCRAHPRPRAP